MDLQVFKYCSNKYETTRLVQVGCILSPSKGAQKQFCFDSKHGIYISFNKSFTPCSEEGLI